MSPQHHKQLYLSDGDFIVRINDTLYKFKRKPLTTESHLLYQAFHDDGNFGKSDDKPYNLTRFHDLNISNKEFELLLQNVYQNRQPKTADECLSVMNVCATLSLAHTGARARDILHGLTSSNSSTHSHEALVDQYLTFFDNHHTVFPQIYEVTQVYRKATNDSNDKGGRENHPGSHGPPFEPVHEQKPHRGNAPSGGNGANSGGSGSQHSSSSILRRKLQGMGI